ncbi:MAG: helix-turn-helix domain-containing protein [Chloroflexota bacterium]
MEYGGTLSAPRTLPLSNHTGASGSWLRAALTICRETAATASRVSAACGRTCGSWHPLFPSQGLHSAWSARCCERFHYGQRMSPGRTLGSAMTDDMTFGTRLRRHRLAAGLTQEALAERAGLSVSAVTAATSGAGNTRSRSMILGLRHGVVAIRAIVRVKVRIVRGPRQRCRR